MVAFYQTPIYLSRTIWEIQVTGSGTRFSEKRLIQLNLTIPSRFFLPTESGNV
jgi:hypothetical protein